MPHKPPAGLPGLVEALDHPQHQGHYRNRICDYHPVHRTHVETVAHVGDSEVRTVEAGSVGEVLDGGYEGDRLVSREAQHKAHPDHGREEHLLDKAVEVGPPLGVEDLLAGEEDVADVEAPDQEGRVLDGDVVVLGLPPVVLQPD